MFGDSTYAHSLPNCHPGQWQRLDTHLRNVAELAAEFAAGFTSSDWAYNAGWLHDFGKADDRFQAYLLRENGLDDSAYDDSRGGRVNHSSAGAGLAETSLGRCTGRVLAYLSAGHHAGLPDWHSADTGNAALSVRLTEGLDNLGRIQGYTDPLLSCLRTLRRPPKCVTADCFHLWMRLLFSCLVDADSLDTEEFVNPEQSRARKPFAELAFLKTSFDLHMASMIQKAPRTLVNDLRKEVLCSCRSMAKQASGIFSLTVPTGGGKTLSSVAFALEHALRHNKNRIIYVIPYTSIIEQTAQVLADIFGPENVIEHHSSVEPDAETQRSRLATENWDAPIIVTTNVQFFESLHAAKPSRCRKLHNIVNSVVILDEAQLLPPELLTPCVDVINHLSRHFGVTVLLSTATQPALPKLDPPVPIIDNPALLYSKLKRVEFHLPKSLHEHTEWATLAEQLIEHEQVLCIVNTRRDCYDLYRHMPEGTVHLSALMCGAHRSAKIAEIKKRLGDGEPIRVISTQLVEAGVDIDFPMVYRALAGVDSIAQAAGRCNREGKLNAVGRLGQVHVFVPPKPSPIGLLRKGEDTARELAAVTPLDMHDPHIFTRYFELFYGRVNDTGSRYRDWLVKDVIPDIAIEFRTAAENFNLIDDQNKRPVFVRFGGSDTVLERLRAVGLKRDIMRQLQRFTVNLSYQHILRMHGAGLLEEIWPGCFAQTFPSLYDEMTGLQVFQATPSVEDLVT